MVIAQDAASTLCFNISSNFVLPGHQRCNDNFPRMGGKFYLNLWRVNIPRVLITNTGGWGIGEFIYLNEIDGIFGGSVGKLWGK